MGRFRKAKIYLRWKEVIHSSEVVPREFSIRKSGVSSGKCISEKKPSDEPICNCKSRGWAGAEFERMQKTNKACFDQKRCPLPITHNRTNLHFRISKPTNYRHNRKEKHPLQKKRKRPAQRRKNHGQEGEHHSNDNKKLSSMILTYMKATAISNKGRNAKHKVVSCFWNRQI